MAGSAAGGGAKPPAMGGSFLLIMLMPMLLLLVLTPDMRMTLGLAMNVCLAPTLGFNFVYPVYTIMVASVLMVIATTILRHYSTDWLSVGKQNYLQKYVQQKFKDAQGNPVKLKKVQELNAEIMKMTGDRMNSQMKTMMYTMVISLLLFMWLIVFMYNMSVVHFISTPWAVEAGWSLTGSGAILEFLTGGATKGPMPNWVLLYSLFSIPIGQVIQGVLKYITFKKMIARLDRGEPATKPFRLWPKREPKAKVEYTKKTDDKKGVAVEEGDFEVDDDEDAEVEEPDKDEEEKEPPKKDGGGLKKKSSGKPGDDETISDEEE